MFLPHTCCTYHIGLLIAGPVVGLVGAVGAGVVAATSEGGAGDVSNACSQAHPHAAAPF